MYKWKVNTQVPMQVIHIKLNYFYWEEKLFLEQEKKDIKITGEIFVKMLKKN